MAEGNKPKAVEHVAYLVYVIAKKCAQMVFDQQAFAVTVRLKWYL